MIVVQPLKRFVSKKLVPSMSWEVIEFFIYGSLCASFGSGAMPKPTNNAGRCLKLKD